MHEVAEDDLDDIIQPTELFNQPGELDPTEIADGQTTLDKTLRQ